MPELITGRVLNEKQPWTLKKKTHFGALAAAPLGVLRCRGLNPPWGCMCRDPDQNTMDGGGTGGQADRVLLASTLHHPGGENHDPTHRGSPLPARSSLPWTHRRGNLTSHDPSQPSNPSTRLQASAASSLRRVRRHSAMARHVSAVERRLVRPFRPVARAGTSVSFSV